MFEVLVLVAVVVVLAQFNKRVSQLEREVADLNANSASQWRAPVPEMLRRKRRLRRWKPKQRRLNHSKLCR